MTRPVTATIMTNNNTMKTLHNDGMKMKYCFAHTPTQPYIHTAHTLGTLTRADLMDGWMDKEKKEDTFTLLLYMVLRPGPTLPHGSHTWARFAT